MKRQSRARPAFTLLELLVVISIIALLASITISAVFRLQSSQKEKNTDTHLRKIDMVLMQQWKATVDKIKQEDPPQFVKDLTKNADGTSDPARAKALHLKLRLRQEFPQNFGEVFSNIQVPNPSNPTSFYVYSGKPSYLAALKNAKQTPPVNGPFDEVVEEGQSAVMLVLILSQGKGGATTNPEQIAPTMLLDYPLSTGATTQRRVFKDEWGRPIAFRRWADDDQTDVLSELNDAPYAPVTTGSRDPQDPEGRLIIPTWPGRAQAMSFLAFNPPPGQRPILKNPFDGYNRGPFAFSAGRDGTFFNFMDDNLYSYRQQQSGRGN
jgi:prepilin-type N-terminal cleavage/methylation domain-containing protein